MDRLERGTFTFLVKYLFKNIRKQITYTTSLLRKYAKTQYNLLLFVPVPFVRQIADMIHHLDVTLDPDSIYRNFLNERDS